MKIAILSDIHDNVWNLASALPGIQNTDVMICCGDLCSPFIIGLLADGFKDRPIHIVFGNNDGDLFRITQNASKYAHVHIHGAFYQDEMGGKHIAVNHYPDIALAIAAAGKHDVVCYGHNHVFKVDSVGKTLTINPGAIMGYDGANKKDIPSTFVIYDADAGQATGYQIAPPLESGAGAGRIIGYP
jgi:putative phosphoesterase